MSSPAPKSSQSADGDQGVPPPPQRSPRQGLETIKSGWKASVPMLDQSEVEAATENYANTDPIRTKTWSRRLVEDFLQYRKWYFPRKDDDRPDAPKLTKAWAYYEHITLARYFSEGNERKQTRAEPGEMDCPTELFNPCTTRESVLNEWGLGVGLYFSTLRVVAGILLFVGLINVAGIWYYASPTYSGEGGQNDLMFSLIGSAVCTLGEWVVCEDCSPSNWNTIEEQNRYGVYTDADGNEVSLVLRNKCLGAEIPYPGIVGNWVSLIVLIIAFGLLACFQRAREVRFDEDKLTATDYSLIVKNPPKDAYNPDDWRDFFSQFADKQVTCVTVALNNDQLLFKLMMRRIFLNQLRMQLPKNTDMDNEDIVRVAVAQVEKEWETEPRGCLMRLIDCFIFPILRLFNFFLEPHVLVDRIFKLTEEIKELQKRHYDVTEIFVTFETEAGQRTALSALKVPGKIDLAMNNTSRVASSTLFQGRVLNVEEAPEPNAVRWRDLGVLTSQKMVQRLISLSLTVAMIVFAGFVVARVRRAVGPGLSGIFVTLFNTSIPQIVKLIVLFEKHATEGSRQKSIYLKITLFRWVNTVILTKMITPFTRTIGPGPRDVLPTINGILWSELFVAPFLRILDAMGAFKKHFLAPRARTQEEMNLSFQGTPYHLGERYTDFTKVLFLCFFYSSLFPSTFFFCAAILFVQYYADKFCLMRIWEPAPFIGPQLAIFSRRYFFSGALLAYAIVSSYAWAQFPYDNICFPDDPVTGVSNTYENVMILNGTTATITVTEDEAARFCNQHWRAYSGISFPSSPRWQENGLNWMTPNQETLVTLYGWTSLVVLIVFCVAVFGGTIVKYSLSLFRGMYKPAGEDQKIDFSNVAEISAYVPQIRIRAFPYPLLCCDVDEIPDTLIGWTDTHNSYDVHNLIYDVPYEGSKREKVTTSSPTNAPATISEHEDEGDDEASAFQMADETTTENVAGVVTGDASASTVPKWPIFSIIKYYPRSFAKGSS